MFDASNTLNNARIGAVGEVVPDNTCVLSDYIPVLPNESYSQSARFSYSNALAEFDENKEFIGRYTSGNGTITTSENTRFIRVSCAKTLVDSFMLNDGSTALPYEPYGYKIPVVTKSGGAEPITTPIYLPTPLYSGEVLRSDGSREVKWGVVDLGSLNWSYKTKFISSIISNAKIFPNSLNAGAFCPLYQCVRANALENGKFALGLNNKAAICLQDDNYTSLENFKQAMQGVMLYYKLAESTIETFTAPQIPTLNGTTVIDVDTAVKPESMTIKYRR